MSPVKELERKKDKEKEKVKEAIHEPLKRGKFEVEPKTREKEIIKDAYAKIEVQTKEEEILEKEEHLTDGQKQFSKKKKLYTIVKNTLKDEKLINKLKEKEYDEDKQEILNNMKKILSSLDLNKTLEQIILINIGYYSSLEFTEGNFANIDYLSFILKELLPFEIYYELGLISLTLFLEKFVRKERHYNRYQYNNFDLINLMHQLDKSDIEGLISIIIKGTLQDEKILKNHQDFLQVLCNYLPINFDNIKEISFI